MRLEYKMSEMQNPENPEHPAHLRKRIEVLETTLESRKQDIQNWGLRFQGLEKNVQDTVSAVYRDREIDLETANRILTNVGLSPIETTYRVTATFKTEFEISLHGEPENPDEAIANALEVAIKVRDFHGDVSDAPGSVEVEWSEMNVEREDD
jgi:hypothetical protein